MMFFCISTALLALLEKSTGEELQHMLRLKIEVAKIMIWEL
jgi:hypothetical protein